MKLLIKLGYQSFAVPITQETNIAALITAISTLKTYKEEGYSSNRRFIEDKENHEVELKILDDSLFSDMQNDLAKDLIDRLEKAKDEASMANSEKYKTQTELTDLKKKLKYLGINLDEPAKIVPNKAAADDIPF